MKKLDTLDKIDSLKSTLDTYRPFPDHVVKQLRDYYRIGPTYTSNAIEGNTLTESEIKSCHRGRIDHRWEVIEGAFPHLMRNPANLYYFPVF